MARKFNTKSIADASLPGTKIQTGTIPAAAINSVRITNVAYTSNVWSVLDDTAVSTAGGFIRITGAGFEPNSTVTVESVPASSVTYVSSTELRAQIPAAAAGSRHLYVVNSDGAVAIRVNGVNYSAEPTWSTTSPLAGGIIDIPISVQLSASSNSTVTYTLQAGSSLPAGLTLAANGLLSGTITGLSVETTYNFTVEATDLELQNTPRAFSITITVNDQYFKYVTTLLSASAPASTFVSDASTNAFNVSVFGDTRPSNFGPYTSGYYSGYFDGNGDSLSISASSAFAFGTGDFTVEAWVYLTATTASRLATNRQPSAALAGTWSLSLSGTTIGFTEVISGEPGPSATIPSIVNQWTHVVACRQSGTTRLFVNGAQVASASQTTNFSSTANSLVIGASPAENYITGYVSNLRIVKGTAVYTAAFTPSTTPLTAIANTSLLTCQSNRLIDNSTNNFTITRNGDVKVDSFDPFLPDINFAGRGSGYFDGTGDYLSTAYNSAYNLGTGDYTLECWFYVTAGLGGTPMLMSMAAGTASTRSFYLYISATNLPTFGYYSDGTNATNLVSGTSVVSTTWYHIAVARQSGTTRMFLNGTQVASSAGQNAALYTNVSSVFEVGREAAFNGSYFTGYIAEVRVVKGTAVYTTAFTPPTAPLTAVANTSLLTLQNNQPTTNSMFLDNSTNAFNIARNGNATQGTFSPYGGGWSNYFDGTGDFLSTPGAAAFSIPTNTTPFTVEAWVFLTSSSVQQTIFSEQWPSSGPINMYVGFGDGTTNPDTVGLFPVLGYYNGSSWTASARSTTAISINTWVHVAFVFTGSATRIFINGVDTTVAGAATTWGGQLNDNGNEWRVGKRWDSVSGSFLGYISNFRFVKGTAVYTTNFTVPTAPLTPIANTVLLTCADNRFIDDSPNNFAITRNGDTSIQRFNPWNPVITTPTSYSGYFDGSGDYLSTPYNSNLIPVSGTNFTAECWVYCTARTDFHNILSMNNSTTLDWRIMDNGGIWQTTLGGVTINGSSVVLNTWTHLAVVQSSNTVSFYINGVSQGSQAGSSWPNSGIQLTIGAWTQPGRYFTGYISNVRIVKGTAVYTSNFTPSTTPLTAVANTSLLTLQSPTFIDNSTNNFTITAVGDTAPRQFNPFGWTSASTAYTPAVYGGSGYFDGTGDFLNAPTANNAFAYGSGNFTVEAWIYPTKYTATIIDNRPAGSATGLFLGLVAGGNVQVYSNVQILISPGTVPLNTWTHIALSRSSNTMYLYINGVMVTSASNSTNFTDNNLRIGEQGGGGQPFGGYITDVRITKGIACYTSNFQPPVAPLTALTNTTLFTNMTGAGIYDSSMIAVSETVGDARINTSIVKFAGKSSISLDGTGDNLLMPTNPVFDFGTGNFTIEFWVYFNSLSSNRVLIERWSSGNAGGWQLYWRSTGTSMTFLVGASTVLLQDPNASRITTGQWYHIAVTRSGTTARMFIDGTQVVSASDSTSLSNSLPLSIGAQTSTSTNYFNGYMSDIRITRGVARYTANFTPATSPFIAR